MILRQFVWIAAEVERVTIAIFPSSLGIDVP
jgi:hypothetical protein